MSRFVLSEKVRGLLSEQETSAVSESAERQQIVNFPNFISPIIDENPSLIKGLNINCIFRIKCYVEINNLENTQFVQPPIRSI